MFFIIALLKPRNKSKKILCKTSGLKTFNITETE